MTYHQWAAQMLRDILVANDIPAHVHTTYDPYHGSPSRVFIEDPADEPRAREIVGGFSENAAAHPVDAAWSWKWRCPNCGEDVEPQFGECWNCQTPKPSPV